MINLKNKIRIAFLPMITAAVLLASCNKDVKQFDIPAPAAALSNISIDSILKSNPNDSLFYRLILKANSSGMNFSNILKNTAVTNQYTVFAVDNNGMKAFINAATGGLIPLAAPDAVFVNFISGSGAGTLPIASAAGIVSYNIIPQKYDTASIPNVFPNFPVGTSIFPSPTAAPFLTFRTFPSKRPGILRVNTLPMTTPLNVFALNGIIHHVASLVTPPNPTFLWDRINTDVTPVTGLSYLRAAILRADSGTGTPGTLQAALLNAAANLTVFAPTDAVFQATLTALITQALIAQGFPPATAAATAASLASTPAVFSNPLLFSSLSATTVKGIVVYHLFSNTAFTANFPTTATKYPTLLNTAFPTHPGIELAATFTGAFATTATVKGAGNATAANITINSAPAPNGSSDQFYINGTLHKINQVLIPQ